VSINLISHVYNESYLLPSWIKHHREMFDSAIIIDYASTDKTIEVLKKFAPSTWSVVSSRNSEFDAEECDLEVMDFEKSLTGWKIALNTTEFLVFPEMHKILKNLETRSKTAVRISGYAMIDPIALHLESLDFQETLWSKYHFGVPEHEIGLTYPPSETSRPLGRLMHSNTTGQYSIGRHAWHHDDGELPRSVASILWYGFSPWSPQLVSRKTQIFSRVPERDRQADRGTHHHDRVDLIDKTRHKYMELSYDLNALPEFRQVTGVGNVSVNTLEPELHLNGLPFGHKFGPSDLAQYVNSHFGIESQTTTEAWEYLAHLRILEQSNGLIDNGPPKKKRLRLLHRK
jgi:hypothetical protein